MSRPLIECGEDPIAGDDTPFGKQHRSVPVNHIDGSPDEQHAGRSVRCRDPGLLIDQHRKGEAMLRGETRMGAFVCKVDPQNGDVTFLELGPVIAQCQGARKLGH